MPFLPEIHADEIFNAGKSGPAVTTVGTFDGVHLGHREILKQLCAGSSGDSVRTVVTFEPHPQNVMMRRPGKISVLTETREKVQLLRFAGVDRVLILRFTEELAKLPAEEFLTEIILNRLNSKRLIVGYNHAFGAGRKGNSDFLHRVKDQYGFELVVVGPHYMDRETVSSSKIRQSLEEGNIEKANRFLGRPYNIVGQVIAGKGRGQGLGFPTANLKLNHPVKLIPKRGVYAAAVRVKGSLFPAMLNIGTRPTFNETEISIEAHVIKYKGDLYNDSLNLLFLSRLRDEKRYANPEDLRNQLKQDQEKSLQIYHRQNLEKKTLEVLYQNGR